ncbi:hypothetical protein [Nitrospirillum sp. BR 11828]|uniref:hypothetical protein n=1 Tax=Nitrospirillum sp. BR 11828 TaxID=3104325 RepID=UPI002ACAA73B|nr:hypothetical protein [Nitrospirillum sp. BR 11828]MDZ5650423.1 hypothetical protein [Nitrospirillum sp. BR 11828]
MKKLAYVILIYTIAYTSSSSAQSNNQDALKLIRETANDICGTIPLNGTTTNINTKGNIKAEVNGLVKKLANLGIEGQADIKSSEYEGLSQGDIPTSIKDQRECKLTVFKILSDKFLTKTGKKDSSADSELINKGTINNYYVNSNQPPEPELKILSKTEEDNTDGSYTITYECFVDSKYITPAMMRVSIKANNLLYVAIIPQQRNGMSSIILHNVYRDSFKYEAEVQTPQGIYEIKVTTIRPEKVDLSAKF